MEFTHNQILERMTDYGRIGFTRKKDTNTVFAVYMTGDNETQLPSEIEIEGLSPAPGEKVAMLGASGSLTWEKTVRGFKVRIPADIRHTPPCRVAWTFKFAIR